MGNREVLLSGGRQSPEICDCEDCFSPAGSIVRRNVWVLVRGCAGANADAARRHGTCFAERVAVLGWVLRFLRPPGCTNKAAACMTMFRLKFQNATIMVGDLGVATS